MRRINLSLIILLFVSALDLKGQIREGLRKQNSSSDTITVRFSMEGTIRGDTVLFGNSLNKNILRRYFERNLRFPFEEDSALSIACKLYFIIEKDGHITRAWCSAGTSEKVNNEVTRVARKLPAVQPSYIKGKPVVTQVETRIAFVENDNTLFSKYDNYETDILVRCGIVCIKPR